MNKMFLHARSKRGAQVSGRLARARSGASQNKDTNAMMQSIRTPLSKFAAIFDTDEFLRKFLMVLAMALHLLRWTPYPPRKKRLLLLQTMAAAVNL